MSELSAASREKAREQFAFFDRDDNGYIDFDEFSELLHVIAEEVTTKRAAEGFSMVDVDSDGRVSFEEFISWWETVWYEF